MEWHRSTCMKLVEDRGLYGWFMFAKLSFEAGTCNASAAKPLPVESLPLLVVV